MKKSWRIFWSSVIICLLLTVFVGILGSRLDSITLLPDAGAAWYYWKLPNPSFVTRISAWLFYILHQLSVWLLIYVIQFKKVKRNRYRNILLIVNLLFIILHLVQTHIWYDGLAQDVPIFSSQGSVIVMLVLIIIIENGRRGIFFGKQIKKLPLIKSVDKPSTFIKKYHGYFISWALVYTFWYHPMVATSSHLVGFFYMFLLFIQMSMLYTKVHTNKYWTFILEVLVLIHATIVAVNQANNMWPMFLFGFATIAMITQIYGLGLPKWLLRTIQFLYLIAVFYVFLGFTGNRTIDQIHQIMWIPLIEYLLVFVFWYLVNGFLVIKAKIKK